MGSPQNLSDRGAGEMSAAAKMHGEPLAQLNALTRWYILTGFVLLTVFPLLVLGDRLLAGVNPGLLAYSGLVAGAQLMFIGGVGIKFLPSSLGGNPHVYNLEMALWSYWFLLGGTVGYAGAFLVFAVSPGFIYTLFLGLVSTSFFAGSGLLLYNLWKTMQNRV